MSFLKQSIAISVLLLAVAAGASQGDESKHQSAEQRATVTAAAPITGSLDDAERVARMNVMRTAVEQTIGAYISGEAAVEDGELIKSAVTENFRGCATIVEVVSKGRKGDVFEITAVVSVSPLPVLDLLRAKGVLRQWRLMVIIPEKHITRPVPDPAAETEFINQFVKAGYKVIDQTRYAELRQQRADDLKDPAKAAALGREMGADIVITGEAFSERAPDVMGMVSCRARVEVRAILADTAEILCADAGSGGGADLVESVAAKTSLQRTAKTLAPKFVADITLTPGQMHRNITVEVGVFKTFSMASKFEKALGKLPGVTKVHRESYNRGSLVLEVQSDAESADALAAGLEESDVMKPFSLAVQDVKGTRIQATIKE